MDCVNCKSGVLNEDSITCSACSSVFHFQCVAMTESNFRKMSKISKGRWKCQTCRSTEAAHTSSSQEQSDVSDNLLNVPKPIGQPIDKPIGQIYTSVAPVLRQHRNPTTFSGDDNQDPEYWLKEFKRVALFNGWDEMMCLANTYFFLAGTAKLWFENNEDQFTNWDIFEKGLCSAFGEGPKLRKQAEEKLKGRVQKTGETTQSYIQDVLSLCFRVDPNMAEDEKIAQLMKGIAEKTYQALITKEIDSTNDFIHWCLKIEAIQQKRINPRQYTRLPNVPGVASLDEQTDLIFLIRSIVREELQNYFAPTVASIEQPRALETIIREEVVRNMTPNFIASHVDTEARTQTPMPNYAAAIQRQSRYSAPARSLNVEPYDLPPQRKTDVWRTNDNRPVCFHCGRPGHVVRYCQERRRAFAEYRANRSFPTDQDRRPYTSDEFRPSAMTRSSSPYPRGRSPSRRYRSPSPFRSSRRSPSRRTEEN